MSTGVPRLVVVRDDLEDEFVHQRYELLCLVGSNREHVRLDGAVQTAKLLEPPLLAELCPEMRREMITEQQSQSEVREHLVGQAVVGGDFLANRLGDQRGCKQRGDLGCLLPLDYLLVIVERPIEDVGPEFTGAGSTRPPRNPVERGGQRHHDIIRLESCQFKGVGLVSFLGRELCVGVGNSFRLAVRSGGFEQHRLVCRGLRAACFQLGGGDDVVASGVVVDVFVVQCGRHR